ncbi:hypothetical protein E4U35_004835 [Claviceps purpurea]|nr:hypothetical protein E4U27_004505 [Claviceps purpurea]KAG6212528.1 hypothetical protein E4U35_004835 [Claviceps purpurea]KAG6246312.1 hypothetical protein E4U23_004715 [Claviceps purpurea]
MIDVVDDPLTPFECVIGSGVPDKGRHRSPLWCCGIPTPKTYMAMETVEAGGKTTSQLVLCAAH